MPELKKHSNFKNPLWISFLVFIVVFAITQTITYQRFQLLKKIEQQEVNERVLRLKEDLQNILGESSIATQTLSFLVENYGIPNNFDSIAQLILNSNSKIDALELVNGQGIITHVFPLEGNDVLGLNILKDSIGKDGAMTTLKRKDYFTAGPIRLNQGGTGFVGRRPMFKKDEFVGFTAAVIRLSTLINTIQLDSLKDPRYSYQLAKINPDQSEEVFYSSKNISVKEAIKMPLTTSHGEWKIYVISNRPLSYLTETSFLVFGLLLSIISGLFAWFLARQPFKLNRLVQEKTNLLSESQEKYRTLIEQASDGIFLTNLKGQIIDANVRGAAMYGYTKQELTDKNLTELILPDDLLKVPIRFAELSKGNSVLSERRMLRKDGSVFYGEVNAKLLPNKTLQGIIRDTTDRKELQEILEAQNIELKKTNSELDSFVYSASHELRAPLSSVLGLIQVIQLEENEPNLVLHLNMMKKSIKRLDDFIKDIIEYSRNKHLEIEVETINFPNLIENSIESLWYLENTSKIKMSIRVNDKIDFVSDSRRISILLNNFISNAIKYHDVSKDSPTICLDIKTTKKEAIIKIKDNGLGMAPEQLDKIFEMFYRISSDIMGSGIGLFIVKEILSKLNGTIEVASLPGEGSMFTIKLPNESNDKIK
jgi:PAS domain S-box-containing protein